MKSLTVTIIAFVSLGAAVVLFFGALWTWAIWGMSYNIGTAFIWTIFTLGVSSAIGFGLASDQRYRESRK